MVAQPSADIADLREIEFLTIDPEGSRDLDQALHLQRTPGGGILHYAIADVPAFVRPGGAVDAAARQRGQTLYAVDGRIPLAPDGAQRGRRLALARPGPARVRLAVRAGRACRAGGHHAAARHGALAGAMDLRRRAARRR
ncbi:ribonuclease catalytic domain-containing protein [Microbacterium elymi]|uniref:Ribonuclease catalytic domain-containing protein n=1 Tax=Microbacterium elymi TaxID=2909587 RepID=A0ABY5NNE8_9MICO|nr:ribonuclease catalytic domain-containing protein [Microbacterium elymi]UUT36697.1 ribonuclease catalytic domain-containing protein [Microbacterium elymi]